MSEEEYQKVNCLLALLRDFRASVLIKEYYLKERNPTPWVLFDRQVREVQELLNEYERSNQ